MSLADELSAAGHSLRAVVYEEALNVRKAAHLSEIAQIDDELKKLIALRHSSEPEAAPQAPVEAPEPEVEAEVAPEPEPVVEPPVEEEKVKTPEDLVADHTKDELVAAANEQNVTVGSRDTKQDIAEKLVSPPAVEAAVEPAPAPAPEAEIEETAPSAE